MSSLSELVDRDVLEKILKRTISFLLQSRYISPSLRAYARTLTELYEKIFGEPIIHPHIVRSPCPSRWLENGAEVFLVLSSYVLCRSVAH
jgi:hypothetical protein